MTLICLIKQIKQTARQKQDFNLFNKIKKMSHLTEDCNFCYNIVTSVFT